jgi:ABC-type phosphate transport system substrate-binding protein
VSASADFIRRRGGARERRQSNRGRGQKLAARRPGVTLVTGLASRCATVALRSAPAPPRRTAHDLPCAPASPAAFAALATGLRAAPAPATLRAAGSTTVAPLLARWSATLERSPQPVRIAVEAKGSSTAPPALLARTAEIAAMSRPMSDGEVADFQRARGYPPTAVHIALDAIAVLVHSSNPLRHITFGQLRDIYSGTADRGAVASPMSREGPRDRAPHPRREVRHPRAVRQTPSAARRWHRARR